jgi:asparagine synthase (glutamine-hydrolysing)
MCGIAGFYSHSKLETSKFRDISIKMLSSMKHRGPDDEGVWINETNNLLFCQVRLSILDLSNNGHQPMHSKTGRFSIIFNGEIYNHKEIKKLLYDDGCKISWISESDTETLIEAIEFWGIERTLKLCVGMFAFAIWDSVNFKLTIARDRFGEKPLYWGWQDDKFYFASELSSITSIPFFKAKINRDSLNQLLRFNYIPSPNSIYQNINKLISGHFLSIDFNCVDRDQKSIPYWDLQNIINNSDLENHNLSSSDAINLLDDKLTKVIDSQMLSDVPIGAFLSGGIDSSTIVSIMQKVSNKPVKTYSIGFNNLEFDEAIYAKEIAKHLGADHTELYIKDRDVIDVVPKLSNVFSEPFSDSSQIPTYLLCEMVSKHVTVALSGDAGDELFGGYNQYNFTPKIWNYLNAVPLKMRKIGHTLLNNFELNQRFEKLNYLLTSNNKLDFYKRVVTHWSNADDVVLHSKENTSLFYEFKELKDKYSYQENLMALDSLTYMTDDILVKVDRAAMANSLETRVPFLNHELFEFVWSLPLNLKINNGSSKWILKELLTRYVPKHLVDRPKQGFSVPLAQWLRRPLRDWAESLLESNRLKTENYFNVVIVRHIWELHLSGKRDYSLKLWSILMFQSWLELNKPNISE